MIYKEEQDAIDKGYKFLGWQVHTDNCEELKACVEKGHNKFDSETPWKDKQHTPSGSNCTYWCDGCKHYWKIDMSD